MLHFLSFGPAEYSIFILYFPCRDFLSEACERRTGSHHLQPVLQNHVNTHFAFFSVHFHLRFSRRNVWLYLHTSQSFTQIQSDPICSPHLNTNLLSLIKLKCMCCHRPRWKVPLHWVCMFACLQNRVADESQWGAGWISLGGQAAHSCSALAKWHLHHPDQTRLPVHSRNQIPSAPHPHSSAGKHPVKWRVSFIHLWEESFGTPLTFSSIPNIVMTCLPDVSGLLEAHKQMEILWLFIVNEPEYEN